MEAECVNIDPANKVITCQYNKPFKGHDQAFTGRTFDVPYDVLVVAVSKCANALHLTRFSRCLSIGIKTHPWIEKLQFKCQMYEAKYLNLNVMTNQSSAKQLTRSGVMSESTKFALSCLGDTFPLLSRLYITCGFHTKNIPIS